VTQGGCDGRGEQAGRSSQPAYRLTTLTALTALTALSALACSDTGVRPSQTAQVADSADQILEGMQHYITDHGIRRSLVEADTAFIYEGTQTAELRGLKVTFNDANGQEVSVVTALAGTYHIRDGSMSARGNVVATTPDGRRLTSAVLNYDRQTNMVSSDRPFVYTRSGERLEGEGFRSDPDFKNVITQKPHGGFRGGFSDSTQKRGVLLPGQ
jgi:LPS export ABC transporter protein LptC